MSAQGAMAPLIHRALENVHVEGVERREESGGCGGDDGVGRRSGKFNL